jgi:hypothetical protein
MEIGLGGSTWPLHELSENHQRLFYIVDINIEEGEVLKGSKSLYFSNTKMLSFTMDSKYLPSKTNIIHRLGYVHIDGDKSIDATLLDLEFGLDNLVTNGLICQDDYGNPRWPTVTDAVQQLIHKGKASAILVGDSSIWLTRPEYYEFWMNLLKKDPEFKLLGVLTNIASSSLELRSPHEYFFMNKICHLHHISEFTSLSEFTSRQLEYFHNLTSSDDYRYLQMPYPEQSQLTFQSFEFKKTIKYHLEKIWDLVKGDDWPAAPTNKNDIDSLPDWIKDELTEVHKINLYQTFFVYEKVDLDKTVKESL